jgi:hypothetical protein
MKTNFDQIMVTICLKLKELVGVPVRRQVRDQLRGQLREQVWGLARNPVWEEAIEQLRGSNED